MPPEKVSVPPAARVLVSEAGAAKQFTAPYVMVYVPAGAFACVKDVPLPVYVAGPVIVKEEAATLVVTWIDGDATIT